MGLHSILMTFELVEVEEKLHLLCLMVRPTINIGNDSRKWQMVSINHIGEDRLEFNDGSRAEDGR